MGGKSRVGVTLSYMVGEGLSPGHQYSYEIRNNDDTVVTEIIYVKQGEFLFHQQGEEIEGKTIFSRVLARIIKQNLEPTTLSLILEPLVHGVFVELPPSKAARPFDSDRISVAPSEGSVKNYCHLSPDETINFSRQGLKVAIMAAEIPDSSPQPSSEAIAHAVNGGGEDTHPEVQVKSSNVDATAAEDQDEEETDTSDDNDLDVTDHSVKTPAVPDLTPATSRPTEQTIMETPRDVTTVDEGKFQIHRDDDNNAPFSTAQEDGTTSEADLDASPSMQVQANPTAKLHRDKKLTPPDAIDTNYTIDDTPSSDSDDQSVTSARKVTRKYGKQKANTVQSASFNSRMNAASSAESDHAEAAETAADEGEGEREVSPPVIEGTSDWRSSDVARETARRTMSEERTKRKASGDVGGESGASTSKKRKTGVRVAMSENAEDDMENVSTKEENEESAIEDQEHDADEYDDEEAAGQDEQSIPEDERADIEGEEAAAQHNEPEIEDEEENDEGEDEEAIEVAKPVAKATRRKATEKSRSAIVVIPVKRARKNLRTVSKSKTPPSSAASSAITGKVPSILLSNDSPLHKSAGKWLKEQGATIIDDVKSRRTYFVCVLKDDKLTTTAKVLRSLALGKLVVTEEWIKQSKKAGQLLEPEDFVITDLQNTIASDRRNVFQGKNLFFTDALVKYYGDGWKNIQALAKEAGASHVDKGDSSTFGKIKGSIDTVCFGLEDDVDVRRLAQSHGCTVYHKDLLTQSVLSGELNLDDKDFKLPASDSGKKR